MVDSMSWKTDFANLRQKLKDKKSWADRTIDNNVEKAAHEHTLTTREALFVLARENGIRYQPDFRRLSAEEQNRVTSTTIKKMPPTKTTLRRNSIGKNKIIMLSTPLGSIREPYLPQLIMEQAKVMSETVYPHLYILENSIRTFIDRVMTKNTGKDWWTSDMSSKSLQEIVKAVEERMQKEAKNYWHSRRSAHPLYYTDFSHLIKILKSKNAIFNPYFKDMPGKLSGFINKMEELQPSRNVSSHHNPLTDHDKNRVYGYLIDWTQHLAHLEKQSIL